MKTKLLLLILSFSLAKALVVTDGTVGSVVTLDGADVTITQDLGKTSGNNLFHSFKTFDIDTGNKVTFTGSDTLENVISRVTGGEISTLDGTLKSNIGSANFYFFNPAGILLGPNASIDVPASLHISTADHLTLDNGDIFSATNPNESTLGIAKPEAFGYLDREVTSLVLDGAKLDFSSNNAEFSSHNIEILNGAKIYSYSSNTNNVNLNINAGTLIIDAKDSAGITGIYAESSSDIYTKTIDIKVDGLFEIIGSTYYNTAETFGSIGEKGETGIFNDFFGKDVATSSINIDAGSFVINGYGADYTGISSQGFNGANAGNIVIDVADSVDINNANSFIQLVSNNTVGLRAGNIDVTANSLKLDGNGNMRFNAETTTGISSSAYFNDNGEKGVINITVSELLEIYNGAQISSSTLTNNDAGEVNIKAGSLKVDGGGLGIFTGIISSTNTYSFTVSDGDAGKIDIEVDGLFEIYNAGQISTSTLSDGDAGEINIKAGDMTIDLKESNYLTQITSNSYNNSGNAGNVNILVDNLLGIYNGSRISSITYTNGDAGEIKINAKNLKIDSGKTYFQTGISSTSQYGATGKGGKINVTVDELLEVYNVSAIESSTVYEGDAGEVNINAGNIILDAGGINTALGILSNATDTSTGDAGIINIKVEDSLKVLNGAQINSSTFGMGDAGKISIDANSISIYGQGAYNWTQIASSANENSFGNAGTIDISVNESLKLLDGARIVSFTDSVGNAGEITIQAGDMILDGDGRVSRVETNAGVGSSGDAGKVNINVNNLLDIKYNSYISSSTFSQGDAGEIDIKAKNIIIDASDSNMFVGIVSTAESTATGLVGDINIETDNLSMSNLGAISISHLGNIQESLLKQSSNGKLYIKSNNINLENSIITASSFGNAAASLIEIDSGNLNLDSSSIETSANTNNGGSITINNNGAIVLNNGLITTSTNGGNGGDIFIDSGALMMNTGFIQANTDLGASGGNIEINTDSIITKKSISPQVGGDKETFIFDSGINIIQAAAPQGNPGSLNIISPKLDLTSSLAKLSTHYVNVSELIKDPCTTTTTNSSSLIVK